MHDIFDDSHDNNGDNKVKHLVNTKAFLPTLLYMLPLTERPFFPSQTLPIVMDADMWFESVKSINDSPHHFGGLILTKPDNPEHLTPDDFYSTGTVIKIHHPLRTSNKIQFIAEGIQRFTLEKWVSKIPPYSANVKYPQESIHENVKHLKAYGIAIINALKELMRLNPLYSEQLKFFLNRFVPNDPSPLTDFAASLTSTTKTELQDIIETVNLTSRMEKVIVLIKKEVEMAKLQAKIQQGVEDKIQEGQRNFFLKEQLKFIQNELGIAKDDRTADAELFDERIEKLSLTEQAEKKISEELDKLSILEIGSPEYAVTRNYLDIVTSLPWGIYSRDNLNISHARKILAEEHEGLLDIKSRIIEFIAVGKLRGQLSGSIILLVGPPGVGKTSIGRSIAHALDRKYFRFSVGGMRDEAEIKGHRRTYIGALPGKLIQAIRDTNTSNPVIMLDEIDKIGSSYQGDPAAALLEVLDPEQNNEFTDHYLDLRFDLSRVLFICTANQLDTIPSALVDRMEIMRLSGYITEEKLVIAKKYLWPRQLKKAGIKPSQCTITEGAIKRIIDGYAREAGVRNLEKKLAQIIRKVAVKIVNAKNKKFSITIKSLKSYLGEPVFEKEHLLTGIGVATGLAWTALGGATLNIEASGVRHKQRGFKLTGKLGEVMRESAEIAYSYINSHLDLYGVSSDYFDERLIHLHVPEGATPKDGPSAGITIASALLSLCRHQKISTHWAMTGELTLTGHILAVGGIREKIIAARRSNIKHIILPAAIKGDCKQLPAYLKKGLRLHFVEHYNEVYKLIF